MFITCDLTGFEKDENYWVLGSTWIPKEQLPKYEEAVCLFRLKNKLWGEIKWNKITRQKLNEYKEFLNISLKKFDFEIKLILRDKQIPIPKGRYKNKGELFSTFYYYLLSNHMKRHPQKKLFDVLFDKENWVQKESLNLKRFIEKSLIKETSKKQSINHLCQCDSKICSALQFCDLISGAVSTKMNKSKKISWHKQEIIKYIEKSLNWQLDQPTSPSALKFNLWLWRPTVKF